MARPRLNRGKGGTRRGLRAAAKRDPRFNTALARGLQILRSFHQGEAFLGNSELSERAGIPKATVSRLTFTLEQLGYLNYIDRLGKYELSPGVLSLGYAVLSTLEAHVLARPFMVELANECGGTVGLGIADGLNMTYVECARGQAGLTRNIFVGMRIPVAMTTLGWAHLAGLNAKDRAAMLAKIRRAYPTRWDRIKTRIQSAIAEIETRGFCLSIGEYAPIANAVGVSFVPAGQAKVLAFNCTGPSFLLTSESLENVWGPRLANLAERLQGSAPVVERMPAGFNR